MSYATVNLEHGPDFATLRLNRPEKRNAISTEMIEELLAALDELESSSARGDSNWCGESVLRGDGLELFEGVPFPVA
jgi:enoyl-CoA hydratase/carnithine racemase